MSILSYIQKLLPTFGRNRIIEDIAVYQNELSSAILPAFEHAASKGVSVKSQFHKDIERAYRLGMSGMKGSVINDLNDRLHKLPDILNTLAKLTEEEFQTKIVSEAMTTRKATVLRLVESVGFVSKFSNSLLNAIIAKELEASGPTASAADVPPGEIKRLQRFFPEFVRLLKTITNAKDIEQTIKNLPEVAVDAGTYNSEFAEDADPLSLFQPNPNGFVGNPLYLRGMVSALWHNNRYKQVQEQKKAIDLRLMMLQRRAQNQNDPNLEQEIESAARKSAGYAEWLRQYEESLG